MWKSLIFATSFDQAWGTCSSIDDVDTVVANLPGLLPTLEVPDVTYAAHSAPVATTTGVEGTLNVTVSDAQSFYSNKRVNQDHIEQWLADQFSLPQSSVTVNIPDATAAEPAISDADAASVAASAAGEGAAATNLAPAAPTPTSAPPTAPNTTAVQRLLTETTNATAENTVHVSPTSDTAPEQVSTTYTIILPPGAAEISSRLDNMQDADVLSAFSVSNVAVTSAAVSMNPVTSTGLSGSFLLGANDASAAGIESASSQALIRQAISNMAGVFVGDVGPITFSSANPAVPLEAQPEPSTLGANNQETGRRLAAGSVNAAFNISVPGHAAQGWGKDCSVLGMLPLASPGSDNTIADSTAETCRTAANEDRDATVYSFTADTNECRLSGFDLFKDSDFSPGTVTGFTGDSCGACPRDALATGALWSGVTDLASQGTDAVWPGRTDQESHTAWGVGHYQPLNLQCWPKNENHALMPCGFATLESVAAGWPGRCNNLEEQPTHTSTNDCQASCRQDPFCTVWMWALPVGGAVGTERCYTGVGNACWTESGTDPIQTVNASERLQHGLINVLVPRLPQHRIRGLQRQFSENIDADGLRLNSTGQMEACKNICYSTIRCTVWQSYYNDGLGSALGCWIENPGVPGRGIAGPEGGLGQYLPYPITQSQFEDNSNEQYITGGEFIQHHCPIPSLPSRPPATTTTTAAPQVIAATPMPTTAAPEPSSFWNPWGMLLLAAAALAAVVAGICYMNKEQPKKKSGQLSPSKKNHHLHLHHHHHRSPSCLCSQFSCSQQLRSLCQ